MTIKITERKADGTPFIECFNCFERESPKKVGTCWEWSRFDVQTSNHQKKWGDLKIICLNCGHSHPRYSLGFAKYKHLDTIHLCLVSDGDHFSSRCGVFSGSVTIPRQNIEEVRTIPNFKKMCKKCAREEGVSLYRYNNWYSEKDKELELEFYRHL
ncbi:hypothetical protein [Methylobacter tundripaludum]|uniref:Uncharacterized protein n=1 Tax=Methylobacter tundripaludum (strain ATCC BAA-1195 / DSM 17260 / SV96) TaxID=697282 RepID=G3IWM8_METTV|nr:hypothetical protein [Methylobacter tundripaludum]EGW23087.1 hypothetical protein Mettu_1925 [Methylobacter tundripaludum SV96]